MKRNLMTVALLSTALTATSALAQDVTITIESWRNDDLALWQEKIIPAFEAEHPARAACKSLMIEHLFDPQTIVMGGAMPDLLLDYMISSVALPDMSVSNRPDRTFPRLTSGGSGRMTATRGAAALIINQTFTPQIDTAA